MINKAKDIYLENAYDNKYIKNTILPLAIGAFSLPLMGAYLARNESKSKIMKNIAIGTLVTIMLKTSIMLAPQINKNCYNIEDVQTNTRYEEKLEYENGIPYGLSLESNLDTLVAFAGTNNGIIESLRNPPSKKVTYKITTNKSTKTKETVILDGWQISNNIDYHKL